MFTMMPGLWLMKAMCCMCGVTVFAYYASRGCDPKAGGQITSYNQVLIVTFICVHHLSYWRINYEWLTHWGRYKMAAISQATFPNVISCMKMVVFGIIFHWKLFKVEVLKMNHFNRWRLYSIEASISITTQLPLYLQMTMTYFLDYGVFRFWCHSYSWNSWVLYCGGLCCFFKVR